MPKTTFIGDRAELETGEFTGDVEHNNNYALALQNIADLAAKGAEYWLDGIDDVITIADDANLSFGNSVSDTPFSIIVECIMQDATDFHILNKGSSLAREYALYITSEKLIICCYDNDGLNKIGRQYNTAITSLEESHQIIGSVYSGSGLSSGIALYLGGKRVDDIDESAGTYVAMHNQAQPAQIGRFMDSGPYLHGGLKKLLLFNLALTAAEMKAFSSGAPIPFKYLGASQTEVIASQTDRDFSGANNWFNTNMATFNSTGDLTVTSTVGNQWCQLPETNAPMITGKKYRLTVTASALSGDTFTLRDFDNVVLYDDDGNQLTLVDGDNIHEFIYTNSPSPQGGFRLRSEGVGGITLDNFSLTQIGCVLQLEQPGIGHNQWLDTSGNELHGAVSGALPVNLPADNVERFRHTVPITGDTTWSSVVPAGYILETLILNNTGSGAATLDLGTTTDAHDIFQNQAIAATAITTVVINKIFSETTAQSLYLNDTSTPGWTNVSITATLIMKRVI